MHVFTRTRHLLVLSILSSTLEMDLVQFNSLTFYVIQTELSCPTKKFSFYICRYVLAGRNNNSLWGIIIVSTGVTIAHFNVKNSGFADECRRWDERYMNDCVVPSIACRRVSEMVGFCVSNDCKLDLVYILGDLWHAVIIGQRGFRTNHG